MSNEPKDKTQDDKTQQPAAPAETETKEQDKKPKPSGGAEERNVGG